MNFTKIMLRNEASDDGAAGGEADKSKEQSNPPKVDPPAEKDGDDGLDEYGYKKEPAAPGADDKGGDSKEKDPAEEKEADPASGYDKEPEVPKDDEKPADDKKEDPPAADDQYKDLKVDGIEKSEVERLKALAKEEELTPKQAQRLINEYKKEMDAAAKFAADQEKEQQRALAAQRAKNYKELKEDPVFGGEKFKRNTALVERVLQDFMPGTKKRLTETKGMLPPYVMRDLAKLGEHLYGNEPKLVQGDPKPKVDEVKRDEIQDMYS